jgi:hypothetical protein
MPWLGERGLEGESFLPVLFFKVVQPDGDGEIIYLALAVTGFCNLKLELDGAHTPREGMRVVLGRFSAFPISDLMS